MIGCVRAVALNNELLNFQYSEERREVSLTQCTTLQSL